MEATRSRAKVWWTACRYHFVPPSFLPAILGAVIAWAVAESFHPLWFLATVAAVTLNHLALGMTDDYFDFKSQVDQQQQGESNPFAGGSGTLTSGAIRPRQMAWAFSLNYGFTLLIGIYLTAVRGWPVLAFLLFGIASSYFYTAPPVRFGYRGWGEVAHLVNFSFTIGMGSFYVQTGQLAWEPLWALLPLGLMMFAMIVVNEIPDVDDDRAGGKRTLVVRFGVRAGVGLYAVGMMGAYLVIVAGAFGGVTSSWTLLGLATLPWFVRALRTVGRHYDDPVRLAPANLLTIRIHSVTGLLLITGYLVEGVGRGGTWIPVMLVSVLLVVLYLPIGRLLFSTTAVKGSF